jgi:hypothetical protein
VVANTLPSAPIITREIPGVTVPTIGECFDCGAVAPVERWENDLRQGFMLCVDRAECRRRQFGFCDACITLDRRCWECSHPGQGGCRECSDGSCQFCRYDR